MEQGLFTFGYIFKRAPLSRRSNLITCSSHRYRSVKIDCLSFVMCPLVQLIIGFFSFFFLLRPFTVLIKKTRAIKQSIFLDVYGSTRKSWVFWWSGSQAEAQNKESLKRLLCLQIILILISYIIIYYYGEPFQPKPEMELSLVLFTFSVLPLLAQL